MAEKKGGISDAKLALLNLLQRDNFSRVPPSERILFLPHCLRNPKQCRAESTDEGLVCRHCSPDCSINRLTTHARSRGYRVFVVPGGEMVFNIIEKYRPGAVLGVACRHELAQAAERIAGSKGALGFAYQGVALLRSGCVGTQVDVEAVKEVIELDASATAVKVGPVQSSRPPLRKRLAFTAGSAIAIAAVLCALLLSPSLFAPSGLSSHESLASLLITEQTSVRYIKDADGRPTAEVRVALQNSGQIPATSIRVRVTAFFTGQPYLPEEGGAVEVPLNMTLRTGETSEAFVNVRVHDQNDTSLLIEVISNGRVVSSRYVRSPNSVFIAEARLSEYVTMIPSGRAANVTVEVFNEQPVRPPGSLRLVLRCYSSFNRNSAWDTVEVSQPSPLALNQTWSCSVVLDVNDLDPGRPTFVVELFEGSASSPLDSTMVQG
ncbi:MAG: DUF116 domain-containing protein [Thermoplasmata archaeon]